MSKFLLIALLPILAVQAQYDPHFVGGRTTMVHLFEWRWEDIALECERFLGPYGYGGVQVSPPNENRIVTQPYRPWYERYQPVSYNLNTRSGNEAAFQSMVRRCNDAGVRIYVDAVINHMAGGGSGQGTGGCNFNDGNNQYDCVPYSSTDFNIPLGRCPSPSGTIENYNDMYQVRDCKLVGLNDLYHGSDYVRGKIVEFLNRLIGYGVAGFRVDASKHMWPGDMQAIFSQLNNLPTSHGFPAGARPFIAQEVIDLGGEAIGSDEYVGMGRVTEFKFSRDIGEVFRKRNGQKLSYLRNFGEGWGMLRSLHAFVFVDNHDNQRGHGAGGDSIITYKDSKLYKMAQAFTLAWPYGVARVMSSYEFDEEWTGPPMDGNANILPITINPDMTCGGTRVCEHRWRQIFNMAKFRNVVQGEAVVNWWDNAQVSNGNQIAFGLGNKGFILFNNDNFDFSGSLPTSMPPGQYCDIISGSLENGSCTGRVITVGSDSSANLQLSSSDRDGVIAIHVEARL